METVRRIKSVSELSDRDLIEETLERARRVETRITKLCQFLGFDTNTKKPHWSAEQGTVIVPTDACSLRDILAASPEDEFEVWHKGRYVITLYKATEEE